MSDTLHKARRPLVRRLIRVSTGRGVVGRLGRYPGPAVGWRLPCEMRLIIDNPDEWIQQELLADNCELITVFPPPGRITAGTKLPALQCRVVKR
jgi:hypothetical protein